VKSAIISTRPRQSGAPCPWAASAVASEAVVTNPQSVQPNNGNGRTDCQNRPTSNRECQPEYPGQAPGCRSTRAASNSSDTRAPTSNGDSSPISSWALASASSSSFCDAATRASEATSMLRLNR
jgi:hypothetical protein